MTVPKRLSSGKFPQVSRIIRVTSHREDPSCRTVFTDGSCYPSNPGPGGWAWAVPGGGSNYGSAPHSTNQRMEVTAAWEAVSSLPRDEPLLVISDSKYVVDCFNREWYVNWRKNGWISSKKTPVANRDLWEPFVEEVLARPGQVTFEWVKGHSGHPMNDIVDELARGAARIAARSQ